MVYANIRAVMRKYTDQDLTQGYGPTISTENFRQDLVYAPLDWQKRGLQETASGYGARLNTGYKIHFEGKLYRVYVSQYGNSGSAWFTTKGRKIYVH